MFNGPPEASQAVAKAIGYHPQPDSVAEATTYLWHQTSNMEK